MTESPNDAVISRKAMPTADEFARSPPEPERAGNLFEQADLSYRANDRFINCLSFRVRHPEGSGRNLYV